MYRLHDFARKTRVDVASEAALLAIGFSAEEILTMLCGLPVRKCLVEAVSDLHMVDPCTLAEISDITGIAVPTVSGIVQRALKRLRRSGKLREFLHDVHSSRERMRGRTRVTIEVSESTLDG